MTDPTTATVAPSSPWHSLVIDNRFTRELPADPVEGSALRQVSGAAFSRVDPVSVPEPRLIGWSDEVGRELGFGAEVADDPETARILTGDLLLPGSDPHAMNYGGHQFGNWAGQLGDGRAIALGEFRGVDGELRTLQLKGAGPTPYSRRADGFAVLRSSIREFLCSEAMHHLGVPTTRALSLALTGSRVVRDMLYDGNPRPEPGAVVCRVAPSFLRFGNFQLPTARDDLDLLRTLLDYTIRHFAPHLGEPTPETYARWFAEVCEKSCDMVIEWMRVGFVHGVMNTDNMSIHGLTIDYGPYGWLDDFDPDWTPNTTDAGGKRYRYGFQPRITQWNLLQLANAIVPAVGDPAPLEAALNDFAHRYQKGHRAMIRAKLGWQRTDDDEGDDRLVDDLYELLTLTETDMTIFFRRLADVAVQGRPEGADGGGVASGRSVVAEAYYQPDGIDDALVRRIDGWFEAYVARTRTEDRPDVDRRAAMNAVNPKYVLRNYLAQQAIDAAENGEYDEIGRLLDLLRRPYDEQPDRETYAARRPDWARSRPGCSMLSCSS
ncbi:MAG: YdiU family protein [Actinomycetota bacterium]